MVRATLGVLESTEQVVHEAESVTIDAAAIERLADTLVGQPFQPPEWRVWPHFWDDAEQTANYVLVLDALNFCFWSDDKWRVVYGGRSLDGYWGLAAALRRAIDQHEPILDATYLEELTLPQLAHLLRGEGCLLLMEERLRHLREVGHVLAQRYGGSFARFIVERGQHSAVWLIRHLVEEFPSFNDVALYRGREVRFYKRAQILVSDLHGAFGGLGFGAFDDLDRLTAFADYKVPQVLREFGILVYAPALAERVDACQLLPAGSPEEVEIRAATIWGVELLRRALEKRGRPLRAFELDWSLWTIGQSRPLRRPYHRTITTAY